MNHGVLMGHVAPRVGDKPALRLIRPYRQAGSMAGVIRDGAEPRVWPQGGFLSPLVSPRARAVNLMRRELEDSAPASACNGRGPWWKAAASHMHRAFRRADFDRCGLRSFMDLHRRFNHAA